MLYYYKHYSKIHKYNIHTDIKKIWVDLFLSLQAVSSITRDKRRVLLCLPSLQIREIKSCGRFLSTIVIDSTIQASLDSSW